MGAVFGLFAGLYYGFGRITNCNYMEELGRVHFGVTFLGVNLTFFPMHFLGLSGMPRRIPDYPDAFMGGNIIETFGAWLSLMGSVIFFYSVFTSLYSIKESDILYRCGMFIHSYLPVYFKEYIEDVEEAVNRYLLKPVPAEESSQLFDVLKMLNVLQVKKPIKFIDLYEVRGVTEGIKGFTLSDRSARVFFFGAFEELNIKIELDNVIFR